MVTIIKLDIDKKLIDIRRLNERLNRASHILSFTVDYVGVRETRKGMHFYVFVEEELDNETVIFLQTILESDFIRELLNWRRIKNGMTLNESNLLFEVKREVLIDNGKIVKVEKEGKEKSTYLSRFYERACLRNLRNLGPKTDIHNRESGT